MWAPCAAAGLVGRTDRRPHLGGRDERRLRSGPRPDLDRPGDRRARRARRGGAADRWHRPDPPPPPLRTHAVRSRSLLPIARHPRHAGHARLQTMSHQTPTLAKTSSSTFDDKHDGKKRMRDEVVDAADSIPEEHIRSVGEEKKKNTIKEEPVKEEPVKEEPVKEKPVKEESIRRFKDKHQKRRPKTVTSIVGKRIQILDCRESSEMAPYIVEVTNETPVHMRRQMLKKTEFHNVILNDGEDGLDGLVDVDAEDDDEEEGEDMDVAAEEVKEWIESQLVEENKLTAPFAGCDYYISILAS